MWRLVSKLKEQDFFFLTYERGFFFLLYFRDSHTLPGIQAVGVLRVMGLRGRAITQNEGEILEITKLF